MYFSQMTDYVQIEESDIKRYREQNGLTQAQFGELVGLHRNTIRNYEKGEVIPESKQEMLIALIHGRSESIVNEPRISYLEDVELIELPYLSLPARATFAEMIEGVAGHIVEKRPVLRNRNTNYQGQILIEVDGDSMEPNYPSGTIVRCKQIDPGDWAYLKSGVYAVVFANSFVIKRVKDNNFQEGYLTLHSDNTDTGGKMDVRTQDLRQVWRVEWIEGAPAR
jgi:DNA-binding XRE family transcriptional regulator